MIRKLFLLLVATCSVAVTIATEKDAVYCWVNGSSTCYQLSAEPVITYLDSAAVLTIDGVEQLRVPMVDISQLTVTYGIYQATPTDNEQVKIITDVMPIEKVGKYIRGGRLIIVKDGKQFDAQGRVIEDCRL